MLIANYINENEAKKIHDDSFPFPDFSNKLYFLKKTAIDNGKVIAVAAVRITAEGVLITDQSQPLITRARCSAELIESLKQECIQKGLDECHVFVKNPKVQLFLMKFGFQISRGGQPLVIHF